MKTLPTTQATIAAEVQLPGSKSLTHRALLAAALADGKSRLEGFLCCDDTLYSARALEQLGVRIRLGATEATVQGCGGRFPPFGGQKRLFLGNSGTSYRLLLSTACLARGEILLAGSPRMEERPVGDLVRALQRLGACVECLQKEGFPPVRIRAQGRLRGGLVQVSGAQSSQFVSSLLLAAPHAEGETVIEVTGPLVSSPYVTLTLEVMEAFGVGVLREHERRFRVPSGHRYRSRAFAIEGDASNASYFWAAAAITGGRVVTANVFPHTTAQGDIGLLHVLERMGCRVERQENRVAVHGGRLRGVEVDMGAMPDMVPTLAAVALFAEGRSVLGNAAHLRHKESDRLEAVADEFRRLGAHIVELDDGLVIHGGRPLQGALVDPHDDHRLAMASAVIGLRVPGMRLRNPSCVNKSFPAFWSLWDRIVTPPGRSS